MNEETELLKIKHNLLTQDARCTSNPMYCVQVRRRIWGMDTQWSDDPKWIDTEDGAMELPNPTTPELEQEYEDNQFYVQTGYVDVWETVAVCFTEEGCKKHLDLNGHNYRNYEETRIYVESWNRNPEMQLIRKMIMEDQLP